MQFLILGPLHLIGDNGPIVVNGLRQRTVLAVLLINAHRMVSLEHLVDALWDDDPPTTARRQIQNHISALRRALSRGGAPESAILADNPGAGYRIMPREGELDAQVFEAQVGGALRLASQDQTSAAVEQLRSALGIWRGPALLGLPGRMIEATAARLNEQRLTAIEHCFDLELRLGRHHQLVGEITELVSTHPLRERLVGQLMLALHGSGRQAEALATYGRLRARLADELGLDPGTPLQELSGAILRNDPEVRAGATGAGDPRTAVVVAGPPPGEPAAPAPAAHVVPAQLPVGVRGFTGRDEQLARLDAALADAQRQTSAAVVVISGTAGVGKTALAVHWAHRIADRFPGGQLYADLRGFDPAGSAAGSAEALYGFLDALGVPAKRIPAGRDAQAGLYRSVLARQRVLVILDNAPDADEVRPLLPAAPGCLTVVTSRNLLAGLVTVEGAQALELDVLSTEEASNLLAARLGRQRLDSEREAVDEIIDRCARLPLALAIVAARASTHTRFPLRVLAAELRDVHGRLDALTGTDTGTDIRAVFSWSYRILSAEAARLFRLLGLAPGAEITARAAASLTGRPPAPVRHLLGELTRAHLVAEPVPGRYSFHDLLRDYATELVGAVDSQAERHDATLRILDHYLHTARAADQRLDRHRDPLVLPPNRPDVVAEEFTGHAEAMAWFTVEQPTLVAAVEHAFNSGYDRHAWQLAWSVARLFERRGQWHRLIATQTTALAAARRAGDRLGQAHAHRSLGRGYVHAGRNADAYPHLRLAFDLFREVGDHAGQARVHLDLSCMAEYRKDFPDAIRHARLALTGFQAAGGQAGQARALNNLGWFHGLLGEHRTGLTYCEQALSLAEEIDDRYCAAETLDSLGYILDGLGRYQRAVQCFQHALRLHRELGDRFQETTVLTHLGETCLAMGDHDAARSAWELALTILNDLQHPEADTLRGKLDAIDDTSRRAGARLPAPNAGSPARTGPSPFTRPDGEHPWSAGHPGSTVTRR